MIPLFSSLFMHAYRKDTDYPSTISRTYGAGADYAEMRDQKTYKIIGAALEACPTSQAKARRAGRYAEARRPGLGCGFLDPQITQISQII